MRCSTSPSRTRQKVCDTESREFLMDANHGARPRRSDGTRERRAERLGRAPAYWVLQSAGTGCGEWFSRMIRCIDSAV